MVATKEIFFTCATVSSNTGPSTSENGMPWNQTSSCGTQIQTSQHNLNIIIVGQQPVTIKHLQSSAILVFWSALVGPGQPWSALVGNSRLQVGGFPVPGSNIEKLQVGRGSQFEFFCMEKWGFRHF